MGSPPIRSLTASPGPTTLAASRPSGWTAYFFGLNFAPRDVTNYVMLRAPEQWAVPRGGARAARRAASIDKRFDDDYFRFEAISSRALKNTVCFH